MPTVALLGLGEAGSRFATDLVEAGVDVCAHDPAGISVDGVARFPDPSSAVAGCDAVLSLTAAAAALTAARAARAGLRPGAIYADLNTSAPELKREVAAVV
jgi:3-hydroxyisobutyrate dehydrogenase-like beta-hydroxyacid dehydrogenase